MKANDSRIDDYIANAKPFAQPILIKLRSLVHKACPDVLETIKWGMPSFEYHGLMFGFAAFKQHCTAQFWKYKLLKDPHHYLGERKNKGGDAMGNLGRITSLHDLPSDKVILDFIKQHMKLNEEGIKIPKEKSLVKKEVAMPVELEKALTKNKKIKSAFEKLPPSHRREYIEWITEAKRVETRAKRIASALDWIAKGKSRNWKYEKK
jgi:uncharacterized protein YdeI (YjbR/CyaY-like superfamily)